MPVDPKSKRDANKPDPQLDSDESTSGLTQPLAIVIATLVAVVLIGLIAVGVQHQNSGPNIDQPGASSSADDTIAVAPPSSSAFVRYNDPSHRATSGDEAAEKARRERDLASADSGISSSASNAAAAKAAADKAAAAKAASDAASASSSDTASSGSQQPAATDKPFNPVGRWVKQDGSGTYLFFRSDGVTYESDGAESDAPTDSIPDASQWVLQTSGSTSVIATGSKSYTVEGPDTIQGENGGTYIRVGE